MTPDAPHKQSICAVIVTHNPDDGFAARAAVTAGMVGGVVVVDNGSAGGPPDVPGAGSIANAENLGIAAALNQGVGWAIEHGFAWVLTLDDDSTPAPGMIEHLRAAWDACGFRDRVGVVAANFFDPVAGADFYATRGAARPWIEVVTAITSGSLMPVAAIRAAGGFREDYFIDSVDNEYCLRLRRKGYRVIISTRRDMTHVLGGQRSVARAGSVRVTASDYGPARRYYMTRNRLVLAAEYMRTDGAWVVRELVRALLEVAAMLLLEKRRPAKLRAIALGLWHGMIGRMGPAPDSLAGGRA